MPTHVYTASTAWSAAISFSVQSKVLQNLRAELVWANESLAEPGTFDKGTDLILWAKYPDLSITTPLTAITEGTIPNSRPITMENVTVGALQYGDLIGLTDLSKVKAVHDVLAIATERVNRTAREVIDQTTRDAIFTGGTAFYPIGSTNAARTDIASAEVATGADLIKLSSLMAIGKIPKHADGFYHLYIGPTPIYHLRKEATSGTGFLDVWKYSDNGPIIKGEIGRLHGFRIIEVNNAPTFSSTVTVHAGVATGSVKGWGVGDLTTLAVYHTPPGGQADPLHQHEFVGWIVNFGAAPLNTGYYYRYESAAS